MNGAPRSRPAGPVLTASEFCDRLRAAGVRMLPTAPRRVRAVTHLDVSADAIDRAIKILGRVTKTVTAPAWRTKLPRRRSR